jgi:hypothetical protein
MIDIMGYIQLFRGKLMVWVKIEHPMPVFSTTEFNALRACLPPITGSFFAQGLWRFWRDPEAV